MRKRSKLGRMIDEFTMNLIKSELIRCKGNLRNTCIALEIGPRQLTTYRYKFPELNEYVVKVKNKLSKEQTEERRKINRRYPDD